MNNVTLLLASALSLSACIGDGSTSLAQMSDATVELDASNADPSSDPGQLDAVLEVRISSPACPQLRDDAVATLDGRPLEIVDYGGSYRDISGSGCDQIWLRLERPEPRPPGTTSLLTIADPTDTWTVAVDNLEATDLAVAVDRSAGRLTVTNRLATLLTYGSLELSSNHVAVATWSVGSDGISQGTATSRIDANRIVATLPAALTGDLLQVRTTRKEPASRCEGPATCSVFIRDSAAIPFTQ